MSYLVTVAENSESIWVNDKIDLGLLDGTKSLTENKSVAWDRNKTSIEDAHLTVSSYSDTYYGSTVMQIYMNGQEVMYKEWGFDGPHIADVDVTNLL
ncbi:unnamed protein product, partial [marine sediment metagenome]